MNCFSVLNYEDQLKKKDEYLSTLYPEDVLFKINPSPLTANYRCKAVLSATTIDNKLRLGLYEEGSKKIKPDLDNSLHDEDINELFKVIEKVLNNYKISAFDIDKNIGIMKHIMIRKSYAFNTFLIVFVTNGNLLPNAKNIVSDIIKFDKRILTIIQNIQYKKTHLVLLENEKVIYGNGYIYDSINDLKFRLSSQSFYQVNPRQMISLYSKSLELANIDKKTTVLDCYSGIGTITLLAAKLAKIAIGVEVNKSSHLDAIINKKLNNITNATFVNEDVAKYMKNQKNIDVLIMDPTREGASREFLESVLLLAPKKIVYISCEPKTQIRDIRLLDKLYVLKSVHPFDMFPKTEHVECVALLERK